MPRDVVADVVVERVAVSLKLPLSTQGFRAQQVVVLSDGRIEVAAGIDDAVDEEGFRHHVQSLVFDPNRRFEAYARRVLAMLPSLVPTGITRPQNRARAPRSSRLRRKPCARARRLHATGRYDEPPLPRPARPTPG